MVTPSSAQESCRMGRPIPLWSLPDKIDAGHFAVVVRPGGKRSVSGAGHQALALARIEISRGRSAGIFDEEFHVSSGAKAQDPSLATPVLTPDLEYHGHAAPNLLH